MPGEAKARIPAPDLAGVSGQRDAKVVVDFDEGVAKDIELIGGQTLEHGALDH